MAKEEINLLCTGDLHLGRHPSKIPEGFDSRKFSPAYIWEEITARAVELEVDALLISGDIVDRDNRYFEAFGPFEAGIKRLEEKGIPVYAAAGNHDFDVLPGLARSLNSDFFILLGSGGRWERQGLQIEGQEVLNIVGWSYPVKQVRKNPLLDFAAPENGLPTVGLLHTEVDNPGSSYAPVSSGQLEQSGLTGWVVGHIHKPGILHNLDLSFKSRINDRSILSDKNNLSNNSTDFIECSRFILNPGSPQPLHPTEPGIHGAWQLVINREGGCRIRQLPLATLRYLESRVDISSLERVEGLPALITRKLRETLTGGAEGQVQENLLKWCPRLVLARVALEGYTEFHRELNQLLDRLVQELELEIGGSRVLLEKIENLTRPRIELNKLAGGNSPAALLADYLLRLESRGEKMGVKGENRDNLPEKLLQQAAAKLTEAYYAKAYQPLRSEGRINTPTREEVLEILKRQARLLLDTLAARKEELR